MQNSEPISGTPLAKKKRKEFRHIILQNNVDPTGIFPFPSFSLPLATGVNQVAIDFLKLFVYLCIRSIEERIIAATTTTAVIIIVIILVFIRMIVSITHCAFRSNTLCF